MFLLSYKCCQGGMGKCRNRDFPPKIGISPWHFHKLPLNLHAKIQKNIRKNSIMEKKDVSLQ